MRRDATLYYLNYIDYTSIKREIEFDVNAKELSLNIAIFQITNNPNIKIALSISEKIDESIERHGGVKAESDDLYIYALKNKGVNIVSILFGEESLIDLLHFKKK